MRKVAWIVLAVTAGASLMTSGSTARADDPTRSLESAPPAAEKQSAEGLSYAEREALAPELGEFTGGNSLGLAVLLAIVIVAAVVIIVWLIIPWK